ncbi:MAG: hypothetical protein EOO96_24015 [Pedobacter sp.]|nr:MAG: hypothetical protein EOO96_24015 [Pedobacter sp.]
MKTLIGFICSEAMHEQTGIQPVALLATKFSPGFENTQLNERGYFHSVVIHPDGIAEDSWGKATLKSVAARFGVTEFKTSAEEHHLVVEKLLQNSGDRFTAALKDAVDLIKNRAAYERTIAF